MVIVKDELCGLTLMFADSGSGEICRNRSGASSGMDLLVLCLSRDQSQGHVMFAGGSEVPEQVPLGELVETRNEESSQYAVGFHMVFDLDRTPYLIGLVHYQPWQRIRATCICLVRPSSPRHAGIPSAVRQEIGAEAQAETFAVPTSIPSITHLNHRNVCHCTYT
jgi:hypothetical protein